MVVESRAIVRSQFNNDQLNLIRSVVAKGTTDEQFRFFIEVCNHYRLNPIARQIYAVVRQGQLTIQTSIDGFRLMAERTGKYAGQLGPQWCGEDGVWVDVWLKKEPPAAARVAILRRDFDREIWGVARYSSYVQNTPIWSKMSDTMLAKCAESLAFRKAFPAEMSGIYTHEEMQQADNQDAYTRVTPVIEHESGEDAEQVNGEVVDSPVEQNFASPENKTTNTAKNKNTPAQESPTIAEIRKAVEQSGLIAKSGEKYTFPMLIAYAYQDAIKAKSETVESLMKQVPQFKLEQRQFLLKKLQERIARQKQQKDTAA